MITGRDLRIIITLSFAYVGAAIGIFAAVALGTAGILLLLRGVFA